jgi:indolepyruvate ferredoxin oxidoreductase beta subunit
MKNKGDILFCGVGGQGIVLASEVTALALMEAGYDVKKSEVHGMAQRGGSVLSHLRYGKQVFSPLIAPGGADVAVAFELLESLRYIHYLHPASEVIVNTQRIAPPSVATCWAGSGGEAFRCWPWTPSARRWKPEN